MFEDDVTDRRGGDPDHEILPGEDISECEGKAFALTIGAGELTHQQVGIEEEQDEGDLDGRPSDRTEVGLAFWLGHGPMIARSERKTDRIPWRSRPSGPIL